MYNNYHTCKKLASACQSATAGSRPSRASTGVSAVILDFLLDLALSTVSWSPKSINVFNFPASSVEKYLLLNYNNSIMCAIYV